MTSVDSPDTPLAASRPHGTEPPSAWVRRWSHLVPAHGRVLDIACGHGRHLQWFSSRGHAVTGVDRSPEAIAAVAPLGETILADIENGPWPLLADGQVRQFDAVVVTNYLWRPLFDVMAQSVAPGGVLIYETFSTGNETVGKPSRADFLLLSAELLSAFAGLRLIAFEEGFLEGPARFVQRLAAVRDAPAAPGDAPTRYPL